MVGVIGALTVQIGEPEASFGTRFAMVVSLTLVTICTWASYAGGMGSRSMTLMPMLAKRIGIDPAVVPAPLITTLVDATGLVIYFLIALAVLPELPGVL